METPDRCPNPALTRSDMPDFDWARPVVRGALYGAGRRGHAGDLDLRADLGTVVGLVCGLLSVSDLAIPKAFVRAYVYFVRGTPALVQIFLIYFALPRIGFELSAFWSGVVALAFNAGGFISESSAPGCNRSMPARPRRRCRSA